MYIQDLTLAININTANGFASGDEIGDLFGVYQHKGCGPSFGEGCGGRCDPDPARWNLRHGFVAPGVDDVIALNVRAGSAERFVFEEDAGGMEIA